MGCQQCRLCFSLHGRWQANLCSLLASRDVCFHDKLCDLHCHPSTASLPRIRPACEDICPNKAAESSSTFQSSESLLLAQWPPVGHGGSNWHSL